MIRVWHRFLSLLTPGVRVLLCVLAAVYLATAAGKLFHAYDLAGWLALNSQNFWHGQIWRLVTYALLPMSVLDFVMNGLAIVLLGGMLERVWTRGEFWTYCAIAAAGTGLSRVVLQPSNPSPLTGAAPVTFGLLAAWGCLFGHEKVPLGHLGELTVRQLTLLAGAISLVAMVFSAGLMDTVTLLAGVLAGLLYLWLRAKLLMSRESRTIDSGRINRLEL